MDNEDMKYGSPIFQAPALLWQFSQNNKYIVKYLIASAIWFIVYIIKPLLLWTRCHTSLEFWFILLYIPTYIHFYTLLIFLFSSVFPKVVPSLMEEFVKC